MKLIKLLESMQMSSLKVPAFIDKDGNFFGDGTEVFGHNQAILDELLKIKLEFSVKNAYNSETTNSLFSDKVKLSHYKPQMLEIAKAFRERVIADNLVKVANYSIDSFYIIVYTEKILPKQKDILYNLVAQYFKNSEGMDVKFSIYDKTYKTIETDNEIKALKAIENF